MGLPGLPRGWRIAGRCIVCLLMFSVFGCSMVKLQQDILEVRGLGLVTGQVTVPGGDRDNILVALYLQSAEGLVLKNIDRLSPRLRDYVFILEASAPHLVVAFQDRDGDLTLDAGEPAATTRLVVEPLQQLEGQEIHLGSDVKLPDGLQVDFSDLEIVDYESVPIAAGEVTSLDDPRFDREKAQEGMWSPLTSMREIGGGVYFLEPYDPGRIPVVFIAGIGGSPAEFRALIKGLDHNRFQAWIYQYPTGIRLELAGQGLSDLLNSLREELRCPGLFVTGYSMGGLVARSAVLQSEVHAPCPIKLLITHSTPWGGHSAARLGVKYAPAVIPAWVDMQPGSEFLKGLEQALPSHVEHHLLFGFDTRRSPMMLYSHDTVVSVASQLPLWVQEQAQRIYGFDLDHAEIITDEDALATYFRILEETAEDF